MLIISASTRMRGIVQAATDLSCEIGHNKTTIADIARRLSMSPANIYRFFASKRAIIAAASEGRWLTLMPPGSVQGGQIAMLL